ncbi:GntR family transcriptional regulator [Paenibacillus nasutitermitis]|uniref:Transcriptional regulator n=1 Tax=Paenibacillus nasutitermitis TaxID=1652958 RepID=A0A916YUS7_9BACL|nr:GntR family transcriptional regulator [Paenibacillus nasutitermitis]GGD61374.1 transcriptional regulator [Paenibacillus nasutitermitis]
MAGYPLYKHIQDIIVNQIREGALRPGDRVLSESELMNQYHVSSITAKNALISLADQGIVLRVQGKGTFVADSDITNQLQDKNNRRAASNETNTFVGMIMPTMKTKVEQRLLYYVEKYLHKNGYQLLLRITDESLAEETGAIEKFRQIGVDGMIVFPILDEKYNEAILKLKIDNFPFVLIDRFLKSIDTFNVTSNNVEGTYQAISMLLNKNHRNIAFISPKITNSATEERASGFEKAFFELNLPINKNLWCIHELEIISSNRSYSHILNFLKNNPEITAIFTVNVEMALLTYNALSQLSLLSKVEVITFDEVGLPDVHFIKQNYREMGRNAVHSLISQINGESVDKHIVVPVEFHPRP